jgi:hypothetical protein
MNKNINKKKKVITEIFKICKNKNDFTFDNKLVKQIAEKYKFKNPFDATKFDNIYKLPDILIKEDFFIIHLGEGKHKFVKGIKNGYHKFEKIENKNVFEWKYRRSILNEYDTSESNIISVANNQRIIHDFLYSDIVANPKSYNSKRTKISFSYNIGIEKIIVKNLQMEIDFIMELNNIVTIFEGKNRFVPDFAIYQIFIPLKYFTILKYKDKLNIESINACYILREKQEESSILRLYQYIFENEEDMSSIKLIKNAQYNLRIR